MFVNIGNQTVNLSLVSRVEWHRNPDGEISSAHVSYGQSLVIYHGGEAKALHAAIHGAANVAPKKPITIQTK